MIKRAQEMTVEYFADNSTWQARKAPPFSDSILPLKKIIISFENQL